MIYTAQQRRNHIFELQKYLFIISIYNKKIPSVIPDGIYGKMTAIAVRAFQSENNLNATGETDKITYDRIVGVYKNLTLNNAQQINLFQNNKVIYKKGDEGFEVSVIQSALAEISKKFSNIPKTSVTGIFDTQTEKAVMNIQKKSSLGQDGKVNVDTWNAIFQTLS